MPPSICVSAVQTAVGAVEPEREAEQRQRRDKARPDDEAQHVDPARLLGDDIGHAPGGGGHDGHQEGNRPAAGHARPGDQDEAEARYEAADHLVRPGPLAHDNGGEEDREEDLRLHHHGGEARRHAQAKRREEQAELRHAEKEAVGDHMAPIGLGPRDEDDGRQGREEEAQRREQQRRHGADPELDDDEAQAPDGRDEKGGEAVAERHLLKTGAALSKQ